MKQSAVLQQPRAETRSRGSVLAAYVDLTKPRITLMVVLTAVVGYFMGSRAGFWPLGLFHTAVGTALLAGGANVLNQVVERDADARMRRTVRRAIPSGRIQPESALLYGTALGLGGALYISLFLNMVTALLAVATLGTYVFLYTPLKRKTTLNTLVGAIPGALPPMGGWAAATGGVSREAWVLFLILFLWQIPHFLALAWMLKDDYARGGFRMLTVVDPEGRSTGIHIALSAAALVPVSLVPTLMGMTGTVYFFGALALGLLYAGAGARVARKPGTQKARWLFMISIAYLPALLALMMIDRLPG